LGILKKKMAAAPAPVHGPVFELIEGRLPAAEDTNRTTKVKTVLNGKGWLLYNLLSLEECRVLIEATEQLGYDVKYSGERFCHRSVHHDPRLADWLWQRVAPHCPTVYPSPSQQQLNPGTYSFTLQDTEIR